MALYRFLLALAAPALFLRAAVRGETGLWRGERPAHDGPTIWLHGASNGELQSARALIEALLARDPALHLVVTANTPTARAMVAEWGLRRVAVGPAPLDFRGALRRFLDRNRPDALIQIESELWPNRFAEMRRRGIPVLLVSARLSARSARVWGRFPGLAGNLLSAVGYLAPRDAASGARFRRLGLAAARIGPVLDLKRAVARRAAGLAVVPWAREDTLLAASTHAGEEEIVLAAFAAARERQTGLRLILAPRHPRRSAEIGALLRRRGLAFACRSAGELPGPDTPVFLADTMGEMAEWYAQAGWCFTGGSLVAKGGHTPFEPAAHGCAILHGPHVENFADIYGRLAAERGSRRVADGAALAAALRALDPADRERMATAASRVADGSETELGPMLAALDRLLGKASAVHCGA